MHVHAKVRVAQARQTSVSRFILLPHLVSHHQISALLDSEQIKATLTTQPVIYQIEVPIGASAGWRHRTTIVAALDGSKSALRELIWMYETGGDG